MIQQIPLEQIIPNPEQPRRHFEPEALAGLAQSVKRKLIQPIVVEEVQSGLYMLHDGERRWRAAKLAGLETIESVVRPSLNGTGKQERLLDALIANVQRVDLNPIEEAQSLGSLRATGLTINQIADKTGMTYVTVSARLRLLDLDEEIQQLIACGHLPRDRRVADALLQIEEQGTRVKLAKRLARPGITIPTIINACERLNDRLAQERQIQNRFPRLGRAVQRFRAGRMNKDDTRLVMGVLARWAVWQAQTAEQRERADNLTLLTVRTQRGAEKVYREILEWGFDPFE